jgi:ABC-type lipoprotein release transport system permease subunit
MYDYDTSFAYVSIESAQQILRLGPSVHGIEVKVDDIYSVDQISKSIVKRLGTVLIRYQKLLSNVWGLATGHRTGCK